MPMWKKAMDYLGLGPDDAYDDYDYHQGRRNTGHGREDVVHDEMVKPK